MNDIINREQIPNKQTNQNIINRIINRNRISNRAFIVKTFYIKKEDFPVLEEFLKLSYREDGPRSFSTTILKAMKLYLRHKQIPNPQARLDRMLKLQLPHKPSWQCCVSDCKAKARYQLILRDFENKTEIFRVCWAHKHWKHKRFRFLVGLKPLKV